MGKYVGQPKSGVIIQLSPGQRNEGRLHRNISRDPTSQDKRDGNYLSPHMSEVPNQFAVQHAH